MYVCSVECNLIHDIHFKERATVIATYINFYPACLFSSPFDETRRTTHSLYDY
jgi:hypothetical protein